MSISRHAPDATPCGVLAEMVDGLRGLAETLWSARSDQELVGVVELVAAARSVLAVVEAGAVAEADARGVAKQRLAYGSTGDWLTHLGGLRRGEGRRVVARAHALAGPLARTRVGLVEGRVSPGQADVIVGAVDALPSGELVRARGEKLMVAQAGRLDASDLARVGRHLVAVVDPDGTDRRLERSLDREERAAHLGRYPLVCEDRCRWGAGPGPRAGRGRRAARGPAAAACP